MCVNANIAVTNHLCLVNILNVASAVKQLTFKFYLILINLNLIRHMWLMATILDCAETRFLKKNNKSHLFADFKILDKIL